MRIQAGVVCVCCLLFALPGLCDQSQWSPFPPSGTAVTIDVTVKEIANVGVAIEFATQNIVPGLNPICGLSASSIKKLYVSLYNAGSPGNPSI